MFRERGDLLTSFHRKRFAVYGCERRRKPVVDRGRMVGKPSLVRGDTHYNRGKDEGPLKIPIRNLRTGDSALAPHLYNLVAIIKCHNRLMPIGAELV